MFAFSLVYNNHLYYCELNGANRITFGSGKKDTVQVVGMTESQLIITVLNGNISVRSNAPFNFTQENVTIGTAINIDRNTGTRLYISRVLGVHAQKALLPYNGILKVGRNKDNDIIIDLPFVSGSHFIVRNNNGNIRIEDQNSTNGTYINGIRFNAISFKSGDVLNIFTVQIRLSDGQLQFQNVGNALKINEAVNDHELNNETHINETDKFLWYRRSPRIQERLPYEKIVLDNPPKKGQEYMPIRGRFASMLGYGAMMGVNLAIGAASPALLAARTLGLVPQVINMVASSKANKKQKEQIESYNESRIEEYSAYIADQQAKIALVAEEQRRIITRENPAPQECIDTLMKLRRNLWERMPKDEDFLNVRIGMGYENLCVDVVSRAESKGFKMDDDDLEELCDIIAEENRIVDNVPTRIPLLQCPTIGMIGERSRVIHLMRNMLVSLTTQHCYKDLRIVGIFDKSERNKWASLRWLPHIWDESKQIRFLAFDEKRTHNICEIVSDIIKRRKIELSNTHEDNPNNVLPHYVFIFGSKKMVEREAVLQELLQNQTALGMTSIFMYDQLYNLPQECRYIIDLGEKNFLYDKSAVNKKVLFTPDKAIHSLQFSEFARRMAAINLEDFKADFELPSSISFLQGYGVKTVEQLQIKNRWDNSRVYDSLAAPIGVMENGKTFDLDIDYRAHGSHGLVAGTTGSGKSELLQTLLLSIAVNYHPNEVNFVVIDYKGGGMANLLEPLPHLIGKITNIGSNINRSLISLKNEAKRRQVILDEYGVNTIDKYNLLYKSGKADKVMPHLIIISDEFAELKREEPEFLNELTSIARVGRTLGIHLILATQKPGGVVNDQINSNSRFRICLKVNDVADSRELIKRPDAAKITQAGRAYIRIGEDEMFELIQTYWSGAEYIGDSQQKRAIKNNVRIIETTGERVKTVDDNKNMHSELYVDELSAIVSHICEVTEQCNIKKSEGIWLPELPEWIGLDTVKSKYAFNGFSWSTDMVLRVPIGMYDCPHEQSQGIQYIDFGSEHNYGIFGMPSMGKTTLLKSIVLSLGLHNSPENMNIYILDFGGRSMASFEKMPHVGSVVLDYEEDKLKKFVDLIYKEIDDRKSQFEHYNVGSFSSYRTTVEKPMPAILIAIDNAGSMFDEYGFMEEFLLKISASGSTYGIYLAITAGNINQIRYKIRENIFGAISFALSDRTDLTSIVGRLPEGATVPNAAGRAFIRKNPPVEFQAADFASCESDTVRKEELDNLFVQMSRCWTGYKPKSIPVMPDNISIESVMEHYTSNTVVPVGFDFETLSPAFVDLTKRNSLVISGTNEKSYENTMFSITKLLSMKPENQLFIFDGSSNALKPINGSNVSYGSYLNDDDVSKALETIKSMLSSRAEPSNSEKPYPPICIIINDLKSFVDYISNDNLDLIQRLYRKSKGLGLVVIASGVNTELEKRNQIEAFTVALISSQNGLVVDGCSNDYSFLKNNLSYDEKKKSVEKGVGLLYNEGKCTKLKLMKGEEENI